MTAQASLLALTFGAPLLLLAACLPMPSFRSLNLLPLAPVPGLVAAILAPDGASLHFPDVLFGLAFELDKPGALLLGAAALLWIAAGAYAAHSRRESEANGRFSFWWLLTMAGSLGVFIAADMATFYLFFAMVSLAAYWLVVDDGSAAARRAGAVYVSLALLGEAFLLLGFALLAANAPDNTLVIRDAVAAMSRSPARDAAILFLILGFGLKMGLVPWHVWMPLTYTAAPIPVAAALSGAAVKAGVIGLIRFLPFGDAMPGWGEMLAWIGMLSAFFGVAIGVTQANARTVLAYSSISQMGVIASVAGMALASGHRGAGILIAFYALHHVLVKGGLFLAIGIVERFRARSLWPVIVPAGIVALGLGGLPLTGGALVKAAIKEPLGSGAIGMLSMLSAAASTLLMLHFVARLMALGSAAGSRPPAPLQLLVPWLAIAVTAFLLPWVLYREVTGKSLASLLEFAALWDSLWPVLLGGALALALRRWGSSLPAIPAGDIVAFCKPLPGIAQSIGRGAERLEAGLSQWPVAGAAFLFLTLILSAALLMG
jgi:formate hydrogenlyase subunit 3/multisubunit Na+/H+ antiporter MnhD subunit